MTKCFVNDSVWCHRTFKSSVVCTPSRKVHSIQFNPKEAFRIVRVLSGGYASHRALPTIIQMRLLNG